MLSLLMAVVVALSAAQAGASAATCHVCFYGPDNIVFDAAGNAYVTDSDHKSRFRVVKLSPRGQLLAEWHLFAAGPGKRPGPEGIAIDRNGNVFVTDGGGLSVLKVTSTGKVIMTIRGGKKPFKDPGHVALDRSDNIYVADAEQNSIYKFSATGKLLAIWDRRRGNNLDEWNGPETFVVRGDGALVVEDWGNRRILVISPSGRTLFAFGSRGTAPGQFQNDSGIALDSAGNIYVTDWELHRIQKFDSSGHLLKVIPANPRTQIFAEGPAGLTIDKQGNFYTVDGLAIVKFSPAPRRLAVIR